MKPLLIITALIFNLTLSAQHKFGVKINGGVSGVHKSETSISGYTSYLKFSNGGGLFYNYNFEKKSYVGIDALLARIRGHEHFEGTQVTVTNNGILVATYRDEYYRWITYLALPVYYGMHFKKISVNIGIQPSLILNNMFDEEGTSQYNGQNPTFSKGYPEKLTTGKIDLGARIGLIYNIFNRIAFESNYYIGTNKVVGNYPFKKERVEQLTIGIQYNFLRKEKE